LGTEGRVRRHGGRLPGGLTKRTHAHRCRHRLRRRERLTPARAGHCATAARNLAPTMGRRNACAPAATTGITIPHLCNPGPGRSPSHGFGIGASTSS
jgi:hypothetical protein